MCVRVRVISTSALLQLRIQPTYISDICSLCPSPFFAKCFRRFHALSYNFSIDVTFKEQSTFYSLHNATIQINLIDCNQVNKEAKVILFLH